MQGFFRPYCIPMMKRNTLFIPCSPGAEPFLAQEIRSLGLEAEEVTAAGVSLKASLLDEMKLNLHLRTGQRVLRLLSSFRATDPMQLYKGVSSIPWEQYLDEKGYFSITSTVDTPSIRDTRFAGLKCKDAIADRMTAQCGRRPDSGPERDRSVVHLYWKAEDCRIFLDTSGEPLSKREYRKIPMAAPMQESLAAAVILATGWSGDAGFVNPMCGSGTLAVEAALIALNRPPGLLRSNFGFMHFKDFDPAAWQRLREEAKKAVRKEPGCRVIANDINSKAVEAAQKNAETAGVAHLIEFSVCDFAETPLPEEPSVIVINPEYGERLGQIAELRGVYRRIEDFFKQRCSGHTGFIFTGNLQMAKEVGLRTSRRTPFFHGGLDCRLLRYELYAGSRKQQGSVIE